MRIHTILVGLLILVYLLPITVAAEGQEAVKVSKTLEELNVLVLKLVDQTGNKQIAEARITLAQVSELFTKIPFDGIATVEGIEALSATIIKTKQAFAPIKMQEDEVFFYVTQLHLGIDALNHKQKPLWLRYDRVLKQDIDLIEGYMENNQWTDVDSQLTLLQRHYELIRPAIFISRSSQVVEKMDSLMKFVHEQFNQSELNHSQVTFALTQLREAIEALFYGEDRDVFSIGSKPTTPMTAIMMVGSIIVTVLSFVAWKRYTINQRVIKKARPY